MQTIKADNYTRLKQWKLTSFFGGFYYKLLFTYCLTLQNPQMNHLENKYNK